MKLSPLHRGFSIIEVLVAILVLALGILAVVKLQGVLIQSASDSTQRAFAVSLAQEKIDDLRGFADTAEFLLIGTDAGGQGLAATDGTFSIPRENYQYSLRWQVFDYFHLTSDDPDEAAVTGTPDDGTIPLLATPDFKIVNVFVAWQDETAASQEVVLETIIDSYPPGLTSASAEPSPGGVPPKVSYTPSSDPQVVPIQVGEDTKRETLVPTTTTVDGYARTAFVANTYRPDPGDPTRPGELLRQEEFTTVACDCLFDGTSSDTEGERSYAASHAVWDDGVFMGNTASYKDVRGDAVAGKKKGCAQKNGSCITNPDPLCEICCRDHHDKTTDSALPKYDPYRSSDGFDDGGNHEHHLRTSTPVVDGEYLESCRMKRVDGIWRVYQDWHLIDLTIMTTTDLAGTAIRGLYADYVADLVSSYIENGKVNGSGAPQDQDLPTKPFQIDHTDPDYYVALGGTGERAQLSARAVYLDFMAAEHLTEVQGLQDAVDPPQDYLLHVPFYEVDITPLVDWSLIDESDSSFLGVGPDYGDLVSGELEAISTSPEAIIVSGAMRLSNSGLVKLDGSLDYRASLNADNSSETDAVHVCVGSDCGPASPGSCTLPWGGVMADGATKDAYEYPWGTEDECGSKQVLTCSEDVLEADSGIDLFQYPTCVTGEAPTCETTVVGLVGDNQDRVSLDVFDATGTTVVASEKCKVTGNDLEYECKPVSSATDAIIKVTQTKKDGAANTIALANVCGTQTANFNLF